MSWGERVHQDYETTHMKKITISDRTHIYDSLGNDVTSYLVGKAFQEIKIANPKFKHAIWNQFGLVVSKKCPSKTGS